MDKGSRLARGSLSRETILDSALAVVSHDGVGRLTMRSLAERLGAHPTSMYRHFRNKDELLTGLADRLLGHLHVTVDSGHGWRAILLSLGEQLRQTLSRHPGAVSLLAASPYSPSALRLMETTLAALTRAGLPPPHAGQALRATFTYTVGHAVTTPDSTSFWTDLLDTAAPASAYPTLIGNGGWTMPPDEEFTAGLQLILDGTAAAIQPSTQRQRRRSVVS
ncbi:TetR/AcrR family transcriptional regulator C-terminal domain-containing protein [Micromonospora sp. CPCC 206061]|uniref:TetR/AcrR family transcriptional regulator C-terminal domain-containing protein n=1 Tax=Micromonospora sp. CPCC 206061 TaxID=3122410 RepID=UPI002FF0E088